MHCTCIQHTLTFANPAPQIAPLPSPGYEPLVIPQCSQRFIRVNAIPSKHYIESDNLTCMQHTHFTPHSTSAQERQLQSALYCIECIKKSHNSLTLNHCFVSSEISKPCRNKLGTYPIE